ncbi:unnamed protein product [Pleuronectes platessa]|uniref:Uncharacterized protein n=1 Tax=Pleuronectes platessa TaxID=8262 RepID=A0A9N7UW77_PLEPL|nr:unnamed protein product [Pleuronectes platessa]
MSKHPSTESWERGCDIRWRDEWGQLDEHSQDAGVFVALIKNQLTGSDADDWLKPRFLCGHGMIGKGNEKENSHSLSAPASESECREAELMGLQALSELSGEKVKPSRPRADHVSPASWEKQVLLVIGFDRPEMSEDRTSLSLSHSGLSLTCYPGPCCVLSPAAPPAPLSDPAVLEGLCGICGGPVSTEQRSSIMKSGKELIKERLHEHLDGRRLPTLSSHLSVDSMCPDVRGALFQFSGYLSSSQPES